MTTPTNNNSGPTLRFSAQECTREREECKRYRSDRNWNVSSHQYHSQMKASLRECFDNAVYFQRHHVKKCWQTCENPNLKENSSCWWNVSGRRCIVLSNREDCHGFHASKYRPLVDQFFRLRTGHYRKEWEKADNAF